MLPGLDPLSMLNIGLTIGAFAGGALAWQVLGTRTNAWAQLDSDPAAVYRTLQRQLGTVAAITALMLLLGILLPSGIAQFFRWLSTVGGIIFFAYLGALMITAWNGAQRRKN